MSDEVDDFLAHHGVKGMHWGTRRSRGGYIGVKSAQKAHTKPSLTDSEDHTQSRELKAKPLRVLSNSEIRKVNERLQLEQSFKQLTQNTSTLDKGQKSVKRVLDLGNTAQQVYNLYNGPAGKAVKELIKTKIK